MDRLSSARKRSLLRQRQKLTDELSTLSLMIRGSYLERYSTCSRPGCACHKGKRHGPRAYVVVRREGKQKQHYVPKGDTEQVKAGIGQYHRLLEIAELITDINLELMRGGILDGG